MRAPADSGRLEELAERVARDIPAIGELGTPGLRACVARTWAAALSGSPYSDLRDVPQSPVMMSRSLLLHVNEVDDFALAFLDSVTRFRLPIERDATLAAAILHDVDKPLIYRRGRDGELDYAPGTALRDHGRLGAELALTHGVPAAIAELVRVHSPFASEGLPETPIGTVLHYADMLANDLAAVQTGAPTIHCGFRLVPRAAAAR